jgi:hypothetical protein
MSRKGLVRGFMTFGRKKVGMVWGFEPITGENWELKNTPRRKSTVGN